MTEAPRIVWFRRDLRLDDNPTLARAAHGPVVCLWVDDPGVRGRAHHRDAGARLRFLRAGLEALDAGLRQRGVRLVVRQGPAEHVLPAVAAECGAREVHWARDVSPLARARDARVAGALAAAGVRAVPGPGDLLVDPADLPGPDGHGYRVFTPFSRVWTQVAPPAHAPCAPRLTGPRLPDHGTTLPPGEPPLPAGPDAACASLVRFIRSGRADGYATARDDLAADATSRLSAHLRFGMLTVAQIGRALAPSGTLTPGRAAYWRQLCWREFFQHLLHHHPRVATRAHRKPLRGLVWDDNPVHIAAWRAGRTGYPLVDAGLRELAHTGFMHNRARMVCASFLVKDLLVDWRIGERVFMELLVDGDPASNNGGWQWVAGTGTDSAPYHRVFNPVLQARRFDPAGTYVRRWVPELRDIPAEHIHEPWRMDPSTRRALGRDYPDPIVDHAVRRREALARHRTALQDSGDRAVPHGGGQRLSQVPVRRTEP